MKLLQYVLLGLILFCLNACSVRAEPLRVISYNLESNSPEKTNPRLVAEDLQLIPPADIWGLTEVGNENDASIFHNAISQGKSHYGSILGKTGGSDRLQIIYNTQGLKLIDNKEISNIGGTRAPLVAHFQFIPNQQEFVFVVNHFNRTDSDKRELQAEKFRQWARSQQLPIIAAGDYNFDFSLSTQAGNRAYNLFTADDTFTWLKPSCLTTNTCPRTGTQCNSRYDGLLDFIFLGNQAQQWQGRSEILFTDQPVCQKNPRGYSDHYPVAGEIYITPVESNQTKTNTQNSLSIVALLPKPEGDETIAEAIMIANYSTSPINLTGWQLSDRAQTTWNLDELDMIEPGEKKEIKRNGQKMALNNNGDKIDLRNPQGKIIDSATYSRAQLGEYIYFD